MEADYPMCERCRRNAAGINVEGRRLCDVCADHEIAQATGWPELPPPPAPEIVLGADGDPHVFRYRLFRWPGRAVAVAEEVGRGDGGHRLEVGLDHFEDPAELPDRIRQAARSAVGRIQIVEDEQGRPSLDALYVTGRLEESDNPYEDPRVVIDGRSFSWDEFGELLSSTKGWTFRLRLGDDAEITPDAQYAQTRPLDKDARSLLAHEPPRWFVIALDDYPTPAEWRAQIARGRP